MPISMCLGDNLITDYKEHGPTGKSKSPWKKGLSDRHNTHTQ